jgi:hypothetical protein
VDKVTVSIDWEESLAQTATAATIEVDVMPFLGRTDYGGPFNAYYEALSNLGSEYVRSIDRPFLPTLLGVVCRIV